MGYTRSPLRYPGGKSRLVPFIRGLIQANGLTGGTYVEPFAGAAGIAWALLLEGRVSRVVLNDLDPAIYAFWDAVFTKTDELCRLIRTTPVGMHTWRKQWQVVEKPSAHSTIALAYAAFFLNRTNRSGVIRGGVIGGKRQDGRWRMDARFNTKGLIRRILRIAQFRDRVVIYKMDGTDFVRSVGARLPARTLVFLDPPYFNRGSDLYLNTYALSDHTELAATVKTTLQCPWVVSYDDVALARSLYKGHTTRKYHLSYSAARRYIGREVLFFSDSLCIPRGRLPGRVLRRSAT